MEALDEQGPDHQPHVIESRAPFVGKNCGFANDIVSFFFGPAGEGPMIRSSSS